jgi:ABC-type multidrug transport system fused ATPase/permease subunit
MTAAGSPDHPAPAATPAQQLSTLSRDLNRGEHRPLLYFAGLALSGLVAEAAVPGLMGALLGSALNGSSGRLTLDVLLLCAAIAIGIVTNVSRNVVASRLRLRVGLRLRTRITDTVADAAGAVAEAVPPSQVATVTGSDVDRVAGYPIARIRVAAAVAGTLVVTAYLLWISPVLTALVVVGVPLFMWLAGRVAGPLEDRQDHHRDALGEVAAIGADVGLGLRVLRGLRAEDVIRQRFRDASRRTELAGLRVAQTEALLLLSGALLPGVFLAVLVGVGGQLASTGSIEPTALVTFYAASVYLVTPISATIGYGETRSAARVAAKNILGVLGVPEERWPGTLGPVPENAELVDVVTGLRVPAGLSVLSLEGGAGEQLGGRLAGLDPDHAGLLGDRPVTDFGRPELRRTVRLHSTRPTVFSGTVRDVLDPTGAHSDGEIRQALRASVAEDVVDRFQHGLQERVDADGRSVSGGQRQRLALARSLLDDPAYLILVEPTTALDAVTEIEIASRLRRYRQGRTTLVISGGGAFHAVADQILTLDPAAPVGPHDRVEPARPGRTDLVIDVHADEKAPETAAFTDGRDRADV